MGRSGDHKFHVLLVEDNNADVEVVRLLLMGASDYPIEMHCAYDGNQASDFLAGRGEHVGRTLPDLILIDLNLPQKHGKELLREIKSTDELKHIPTVMLTTTNSEREVRECYAAGANAFLCKPIDIDHYEKILKSLATFWFGSAELPHHAPHCG